MGLACAGVSSNPVGRMRESQDSTPGRTNADRRTTLRDLVESCLERIEREGTSAIDEVCAENPDHADDIRRRVKSLVEMGLLEEKGDGDPNGIAAVGEVPKQLGEFRMLERLGGGGMGEVYRAVQERLSREVAVKVVRPEYLWFDGARERFRREAEAVARLQHPGIVPVYTVGDEAGLPYFAMELVEGGSLDGVLKRVGARELDELTGADLLSEEAGTEAPVEFGGSWVRACLRVVFDIAVALDHAHERGVLHRDIKPSNIMLSRGGQARLLDFGLATLRGSHRLTRTGAKIGSPYYMSPEQVRAEGAGADERSDIYSLGVTLYELLTLTPPFVADSEEALLLLIIDGHPERVSRRNPAVPWDAETVCLKAMDVDPSRRYPTAEAFARDLLNILELRPIEAVRPGPLLRMRRWVQRRPAQAIGSLLVFVLFVVLPTTLLVQQWRANQRISRSYRAEQASFARADEAVFEALGVIDQILLPATDPRLRANPATRGLQRKMLDSVSGMMTRLGELSEDASPTVRRRSHEVLLQLASLRGAAGDFEESCASFNTAVMSLRRQVAEDPSDVDLRAILAGAHFAYAQLMSDFSRLSESMAHVEESEALYARLIAEDPGRIDWRLDLARVRGLRARALVSGGDYSGAREVASAIAASLEALEENGAKGLAVGRELAAQYGTIAWVDVAFGRNQEAIEGLRKALPLAADASSGSVDSIHGVIHMNLGLALAANGELEEGRKHLAWAVEEIDQTMQEVGDSAHYGSQLAKTLLHAAEIELDRGDLSEARAHFERSIALGTRLAEIYPQRYDVQRSLANGCGSLADLDRDAGDHEVAIEGYKRAIEWQGHVIGVAPEQLDHENQCHNWTGLAFTLVADGDLEGSLTAIGNAIDQVIEAQQVGPSSDVLRTLHRGVLFDRSGFLLQASRHAEAIEDAITAVAIIPDSISRSKAVRHLLTAVSLASSDEALDSKGRSDAVDRYAITATEFLESDLLDSEDALAILASPVFDVVRDHPRFLALAEKLAATGDG